MKGYCKLSVIAASMLLLVALLLSSAVGCAERGDIEYSEHGLEFTLPREMRKTQSAVYEIFYTTPEATFAAMKLDSERLTSLEVDGDITAEEYAELFLDINGVDKDLCEITYNERNDSYNFSYSRSEDGESYYYCRVLIVNSADAFYYVGMNCDYNRAYEYEQIFNDIARTVRAEK